MSLKLRDIVLLCFESFHSTYFAHNATDFNAATRAVYLWFLSGACVLHACHVGGYGCGVGSGNCHSSIFNLPREETCMPFFVLASCSWALPCNNGAGPAHFRVIFDMFPPCRTLLVLPRACISIIYFANEMSCHARVERMGIVLFS